MKALIFYAPKINKGEFEKEARRFRATHGIPLDDLIPVSNRRIVGAVEPAPLHLGAVVGFGVLSVSGVLLRGLARNVAPHGPVELERAAVGRHEIAQRACVLAGIAARTHRGHEVAERGRRLGVDARAGHDPHVARAAHVVSRARALSLRAHPGVLRPRRALRSRSAVVLPEPTALCLLDGGSR